MTELVSASEPTSDTLSALLSGPNAPYLLAAGAILLFGLWLLYKALTVLRRMITKVIALAAIVGVTGTGTTTVMSNIPHIPF